MLAWLTCLSFYAYIAFVALQLLSTHPDRPERMASFQLRCMAALYTSDAVVLNRYAALHPSSSRSAGVLRLPYLHLRSLLSDLSPADLTDIASLLTCTAEYNVPREVCK